LRSGRCYCCVSAADGALFSFQRRKLTGDPGKVLTADVTVRDVYGARLSEKGVMRMGSLTVPWCPAPP
jgi:hypothetical protein